jgi:predicted 2-oxoglutarate/Fe(II)-dependent dioxygenase YbiX
MTTEKQISANQQNAKHSTGPRTESGKRRSRRNAIRHGLTAEPVIDGLEDPADYKGFERAIKSNYSPQTCRLPQVSIEFYPTTTQFRKMTTHPAR